MSKPTTLLWLDLETTGLNPYHDRILEVAAFKADINEPFKIVQKRVNACVSMRDWSEVEEYIVEMHTNSGLIGDCLRSRKTLSGIEMELLGLLYDTGSLQPVMPEEHSIVLAGSSVGGFDLPFINRYMPRVAQYLHYRVYDVSAVRNFAYSLGMPEMEISSKAHRAWDDVLASVKLGQDMARWFRDECTKNNDLVIPGP